MAFADEITEIKRIKVDSGCQYSEPIYLTWLNEYGGSSYWLFKKINSKVIETKEGGYYEKYLTDLDAQGNDAMIRKDVELTQTVGARVNKSDTDGLNGLFKSLKVKMLNITKWQSDSTIEWSDVRVKQGSLIYYDNNAEYITLEFEIILPKQYTIGE